MTEKQRKKLLCTGCPRSGTRYATRVFQNIGIHVRHERVGQDGAVCSYFAVDDYWYQSTVRSAYRRKDMEFDHIFHIVRHPLKCIASMAAVLKPVWWHWQQAHTGIKDYRQPLRSMLFWLAWNEIIEPQAEFRFQMECFKEAMPEICARLGIEQQELPDVAQPVAHKHDHPPYEWADLFNADRRIAEQIQKKAIQYGYEV